MSGYDSFTLSERPTEQVFLYKMPTINDTTRMARIEGIYAESGFFGFFGFDGLGDLDGFFGGRLRLTSVFCLSSGGCVSSSSASVPSSSTTILLAFGSGASSTVVRSSKLLERLSLTGFPLASLAILPGSVSISVVVSLSLSKR